MLPFLTSIALAAPPTPGELAADPPDDTTAVLLSSIVGFGAGHFYADQPRAGNPHALLQGLSTAGLVGGGVLLVVVSPGHQPGSGSDDLLVPTAVLVTAGTLFLVDRIVDIATAPRSVRRTRAGEWDH